MSEMMTYEFFDDNCLRFNV